MGPHNTYRAPDTRWDGLALRTGPGWHALYRRYVVLVAPIESSDQLSELQKHQLLGALDRELFSDEQRLGIGVEQ